MNEKINEEEPEKADKVLVEEIEKKLEEFDLKEKQCNGGHIQWIAERQAALAISHILMRKKGIGFRDANKAAWQYVYDVRNKPCTLQNEESVSDELTRVEEKPEESQCET